MIRLLAEFAVMLISYLAVVCIIPLSIELSTHDFSKISIGIIVVCLIIVHFVCLELGDRFFHHMDNPSPPTRKED